jgi:hypothetical protein
MIVTVLRRWLLAQPVEDGPLSRRPGGRGQQVETGRERDDGGDHHRCERQHPEQGPHHAGLLGGGRSCRPSPAPRRPGREPGDQDEEAEQSGEHQPVAAPRARPGEPVAAERRAEQALLEQDVGAAADGAGQEQPVHDGEERNLQQGRQAAAEHPRPLPRVQGGQFTLQAFWLLGMTPVQFLDPGRQPGLRPLPPERVIAERHHQQPHQDREHNDRRGGGQPGGERGERARERGHKVVGSIDGQAKQRRHNGSPSSGDMDDSWRRPPLRGIPGAPRQRKRTQPRLAPGDGNSGSGGRRARRRRSRARPSGRVGVTLRDETSPP